MTTLREAVRETLAARVMRAIETHCEADFSDAIATLYDSRLESREETDDALLRAKAWDKLLSEVLAHILLERSGWDEDDSLATVRGDAEVDDDEDFQGQMLNENGWTP